MKKDKLLEEFEEMRIEDPRNVIGGQMGHDTATETEDCSTCDSSTHQSPEPGDDDCDSDSDTDPDPIILPPPLAAIKF